MTRLYDGTPKQWDHTGYVVPEVEHSESQYPHAELKPASWLPVLRQDTKTEEYTVIAAGKVVAVDRTGRVVPAGLKLTFEAALGATVLTYAAADVTTGTVDLTTGSAVTSTTSYTQTQLTTALRARGLIEATETARDFISEPVGYARYSYWQWCGGDGWDPSQFRRHNHNLQHQVAIGCDKVLEVPMVPSEEATETQGGGIAIANTAITFGTAGWKSSTGIAATTRYASLVSAGDNVVAMVLNKLPVAKITTNTPITDSASTLASMTEVTSIAAVIAGGSSYFYVDYEVGVIFLYESGGNAIPTGFSTANTITYYTYEDAATGSANIVQVLGDVKIGDFVTYDDNSNFVKFQPQIISASGGANGDVYAADPDYDTAGDSAISAQLESYILGCTNRCIGQVLNVFEWPRGGLEKVMTQYRTLTAYERMPGTATDGLSDAHWQSGGANKTAIINFIKR
jgi:hypothetical protein